MLWYWYKKRFLVSIKHAEFFEQRLFEWNISMCGVLRKTKYSPTSALPSGNRTASVFYLGGPVHPVRVVWFVHEEYEINNKRSITRLYELIKAFCVEEEGWNGWQGKYWYTLTCWFNTLDRCLEMSKYMRRWCRWRCVFLDDFFPESDSKEWYRMWERLVRGVRVFCDQLNRR